MARNLPTQRQRKRKNLRREPKYLKMSPWNFSLVTLWTPLLMTSFPPKRSRCLKYWILYCNVVYLIRISKSNAFVLLRLHDLTERDLAKQEREKVLNSLEAFIFETQVRDRSLRIGDMKQFILNEYDLI